MDDIVVTTSSTTGKKRALKNYNNIAISCPNAGDEVTDTSRNVIRLIVEAVDAGWFRADVKEIGLLGTVHSSTKNEHGDVVEDSKHITVTLKPGGKAKHLYVLPDEKTATLTAEDTLDTSKPPSKP